MPFKAKGPVIMTHSVDSEKSFLFMHRTPRVIDRQTDGRTDRRKSDLNSGAFTT